ncbi:MAG: ABC transporter permease, partial [Clostridiales bacterium]
TDAYAGFSTLSVSGTRGAATATAIGVGGDFFLFHPLTLRNGSYINGDDLMKDRVVLDEELAWKLFGGVELAGLTVTINNQLYQVVGVVSREKDPFSNKAYGDGDACIYVDYSVIAATNEQGITCYEVAMPDPISEFAFNTVEAIFPDKRGAILENNTRYRLANIVKLITDSDERVMQKNGVAYPYWENAARLVENRMTLLLPCLAFLTLFPMGCVSYMIIKQYLKLLRKWQKRRAEKLEYQ